MPGDWRRLVSDSTIFTVFVPPNGLGTPVSVGRIGRGRWGDGNRKVDVDESGEVSRTGLGLGRRSRCRGPGENRVSERLPLTDRGQAQLPQSDNLGRESLSILGFYSRRSKVRDLLLNLIPVLSRESIHFLDESTHWRPNHTTGETRNRKVNVFLDL